MKEQDSFEGKIYVLIRLIAIISSFVILFVNAYLIYRDWEHDRAFAELVLSYRFLLAGATEIFLLSLSVFPYKFELVAVFAFLYTGILLYADPLNLLCVPIFFLGVLSLYFRGLLRRNKGPKIVCVSAGIVLVLFSNYRYGRIFFLDDFCSKLCGCVVCLLMFMFILIERNKNSSGARVLDLSRYPELTERDKAWIVLALSQEKYDTIARKYKLSPNYVKNRMRILFRILGVPDRLALLASFGGYEVKM